MKKLLILVILFFLVFHPTANAATPTPTKPQPSTKETLDKKLSDQINNLKEKIASRVSELNLVERRGMIGVISEVSGNKLTLTDIYGKTRFADVDEITKFSSGSNKTFGLSDLKKDTRITILGLYNKQSKRILARFISTTVDPVFLSGAISALDEDNFQATVATPDGKQMKIDVQTTTKIFTADQDNALNKSGFSKLQIGNRVVIIGFPDKKDSALLVANRLLAFPLLARHPKIKVSEPAPTASETTPSPTKKVTPTTKP